MPLGEGGVSRSPQGVPAQSPSSACGSTSTRGLPSGGQSLTPRSLQASGTEGYVRGFYRLPCSRPSLLASHRLSHARSERCPPAKHALRASGPSVPLGHKTGPRPTLGQGPLAMWLFARVCQATRWPGRCGPRCGRKRRTRPRCRSPGSSGPRRCRTRRRSTGRGWGRRRGRGSRPWRCGRGRRRC